MRTTRQRPAATAIGLALFAAASCGTGGSEEPGASDTTSTTRLVEMTTTDPPITTATTTTTTTSSEADRAAARPSRLVVVDADDLVAIDLDEGTRVVLAEGTRMADSLGLTEGVIVGVDLSPDGTKVAFTYGARPSFQSTFGLYEVATDGSSPPVRLPLGVDAEHLRSLGETKYSPDGTLLAVASDSGLVVLGDGGHGEAHPMATNPGLSRHVLWSPSGDQLAWVVQRSRYPCCQIESADIDPATGQVLGEITHIESDSLPWFDAEGSLQTYPSDQPWRSRFDTDASNRFILTEHLDEGVSHLVWWDTEIVIPAPQRLELDIDLTSNRGARTRVFAW
ncbi:MAG: hypothetical protein JJU45_06525 [Acidimicrobiia bacterium]|nr:hypothetical protein [Acidimicrobiia bacterium]